MRHITWLLVTLFTALTILSACSSSREYQHDNDQTRRNAADAQRDLEHEEEQHR